MQLNFYFPFKSLFIQTQHLNARSNCWLTKNTNQNPYLFYHVVSEISQIDFYK